MRLEGDIEMVVVIQHEHYSLKHRGVSTIRFKLDEVTTAGRRLPFDGVNDTVDTHRYSRPRRRHRETGDGVGVDLSEYGGYSGNHDTQKGQGASGDTCWDVDHHAECRVWQLSGVSWLSRVSG